MLRKLRLIQWLRQPILADALTAPSAAASPLLGTHKPQFLWNLTRTELVTTRFMRNRVLFSMLADTILPLRRAQKGRPLKILFWACSTGCEPYTLKFLLGPGSTDEIVGIDQDASAVRKARAGVYQPDSWRGFFTDEMLLTEHEVRQLFDRGPSGTPRVARVAELHRRNVTFLTGNLFSDHLCVAPKSFDLVVCNNLLLHLKPESADLAWDYLHRYMHDAGLLLVGGCNPAVRLAAAKRLQLRPLPDRLKEVHSGWNGVSGAWNFAARPRWAYPEPDENDPDYEFLAGELFEHIQVPR
jgi:chemotaxis methyl-accepting protein methylase